MPYCRSCGRQVTQYDSVCPNCGAAQPPVAEVIDDPGAGADAEENMFMGIIAYIGPLVFVPMFAAKNSPFARFHANQGLALLILEGALVTMAWPTIVIAALTRSMTAMAIVSVFFWLAAIGLSVLMVFGIVYAAMKKTKKLPILGSFKLLK